MSNSVPRAAAATAKDRYPPTHRDNFHGETSVQSFSYPNSQKQQIPQSQPQPQQGYLLKDDLPPPPNSSKQPPQPKGNQVRPPTNNFLQSTTLSSDQPLKQQQQLPKGNNQIPPQSGQTWGKSRQQEPSNGVTTKDNHDHVKPHIQHHQQQPMSSPQIPLKQSDQTSTHQSQQPRQPPNQTHHPFKDHPQSINQPQKQQLSVEEISLKDQHPPTPKNKNQTSQQQQPPIPIQVSSKDVLHSPVLAHRNTAATSSNNNRNDVGAKPETIPDKTCINNNKPTIEVSSKEVQHPSKKNNNQSQQQQPITDQVFSKDQHPAPPNNNNQSHQQPLPTALLSAPTTAKLQSNDEPVDPVVAYPDLSCLPPNTKVTITFPPAATNTDRPMNVPQGNPQPESRPSASNSQPKKDCSCSIQ